MLSMNCRVESVLWMLLHRSGRLPCPVENDREYNVMPMWQQISGLHHLFSIYDVLRSVREHHAIYQVSVLLWVLLLKSVGIVFLMPDHVRHVCGNHRE